MDLKSIAQKYRVHCELANIIFTALCKRTRMRTIIICIGGLFVMEVWQILLLKGNDSFNKQELLLAEDYYHQAIECLEQQWQAKIEDYQLLMAWISAFHNLAVLYEEQDQPKLAFRYLQIPHQRMAELSQHSAHSEDLKLVAILSLKITLMPLLAFSKKYPACDGCLSSLNKMAMAVNASQPVMH